MADKGAGIVSPLDGKPISGNSMTELPAHNCPMGGESVKIESPAGNPTKHGNASCDFGYLPNAVQVNREGSANIQSPVDNKVK